MDISSLPDAHLRIFDRPAIPDTVESVYFIAICGTGMGSLAGLFKEAGYQVGGSDENVYPPMSIQLEKAGIHVYKGYDEDHLKPAPDLVVIGNACTPTHLEGTYARENNLVQLSFPEALSHFFLRHRRSLVIAGTHGKTTTTGMVVHLFRRAGLDPGFLVGGILQGDESSAHQGTGKHFIVEGDEYDTAYFDKGPKLLHYRPSSAIVTSLELDHTDIYPNLNAYRKAFQSFVALLPASGTLVLCSDYDEVRDLARYTRASVIYYGLDEQPATEGALTVSARRGSVDASGQTFTYLEGGVPVAEFHLPAHGNHNLSNALAAIALARAEGIPTETLQQVLPSYKGMKRRQEVRDEIDGVLVLDDFAHHPTAVKETLIGVKQQFPDRRIVAVFEPRSNSSRRKDFHSVYIEAFDAADEVILSTPPFRHNDDATNFLDIEALVRDIEQRDIPAHAFPDVERILHHLLETTLPGDVVLIMSNGGFGGIHNKFLKGLASRIHSTP